MAELLEQRSTISFELITQLLQVFSEFNQNNIWSRVEKDDFIVTRFDLGNDSNLCCCQLTNDAKNKLKFDASKNQSGIVVKFISPDDDYTITDIVAVNTMLAENKISPKLIFVNSKCYIHEYIPSRTYRFEDDDDPEIVKQLARILAKFHSLDAPISNKFFIFQNKSYDDFLHRKKHITGWGETEATGQKYLKVMDQHPEIKEKYYGEFAAIDYHTEIVYVHELIEKLRSPIVFAHSDFNRGNRLISETADGQKKIHLIDFDATCMNYRAADFGDYFANYRHKEDFADEGFPTDQEMELFLEEYRAECERIHGLKFIEKEENSLEQMIAEAKIFTLSSYIGETFFGLMLYQEAHNTAKGKYFFNVAKNQNRGYNKLKKRFIDDGTIPKILFTN